MLKTIIVDDEQKSRKGLELLLKETGYPIELVEQCSNAQEGIAAIIQHRPDLVLLDIDMPQMNGFELLECVKSLHPRIIFVTAHNRYAIQAFRYSALDYLLKPVVKEELVQALEKALELKNAQDRVDQYNLFLEQVKQKVVRPEVIALPVAAGLMFTHVKDISYCRAERNYTFMHMVNGEKLLVTRPLKEFEALLSDHGFFRVHNSTLVNLCHVKMYIRGEGGYIIMSDKQNIDVSRYRKEEFLKALNIL